MGLTNYRLAKEIDVPAQRIGDIIAGKRGITAETDLRLCRFFGLTDGWWLRLQGDYDTRLARAALAKKLAKIQPWSTPGGESIMSTATVSRTTLFGAGCRSATHN